MKDYSLKDYSFSFDGLSKDLFTEINPILVGAKVRNKANEIYEISSISNLNACEGHDGVSFHVNVGSKIFMSWALGNSLVFENTEISEKMTELNALLTKLSEEYKAHMKELDKAEQEALAAKQAAKEKEEKEKKEEIKRLNQQRSTLKALNEIKSVSFKRDLDFYSALGWLYKNTKSIIASIPDFCESWFTKTFDEAPHFTVDTSKPTSGGYLKKWNCSFQLNLKSAEGAPSQFANYIAGKKICNTELIYSLVKDYGFKFGSIQNLDKVLDNIPTDKLDSFKLGLAA